MFSTREIEWWESEEFVRHNAGKDDQEESVVWEQVSSFRQKSRKNICHITKKKDIAFNPMHMTDFTTLADSRWYEQVSSQLAIDTSQNSKSLSHFTRTIHSLLLKDAFLCKTYPSRNKLPTICSCPRATGELKPTKLSLPRGKVPSVAPNRNHQRIISDPLH